MLGMAGGAGSNEAAVEMEFDSLPELVVLAFAKLLNYPPTMLAARIDIETCKSSIRVSH